MSKEAIELLEIIFAIADNDEPDDEPLCSFPKIKKLAAQALTALKQQPPAGEFTANMRLLIGHFGHLSNKYSLEACNIIDSTEAENRRLKKAINDYGNNPAGFDWAVLEKIEIQEAINKDLLHACEFAKSQIKKNAQKKALPILRAAIAKSKKEGER